MNNNDSVSLNKYISGTGICSRREADEMIDAGRVTLNGEVARKGNRVAKGDTVLLDGRPLGEKPEPIYLAFNKPVGVTCTTDRKDKDNIIDYIGHEQRLFPIGRLDKPSQGLIFLTNDGDIVNKILRAGNAHEKEYIVWVNKPVTPKFVGYMSGGLPILGTTTQRCEVERLTEFSFRIVLTEGMNRQIRRMCEFLGYGVAKLKRVRIMNVELGKLPLGKTRALTDQEMALIMTAVENSVGTEEASVREVEVEEPLRFKSKKKPKKKK
ncbi:23S rRNA pseudouridine(2604) synthase RluF [Lewinellaceae bacterium SD302]|nr:23S rRNA pseudouridine(2604) synthase RluF [Lewinellaceae bacterium SD302]